MRLVREVWVAKALQRWDGGNVCSWLTCSSWGRFLSWSGEHISSLAYTRSVCVFGAAAAARTLASVTFCIRELASDKHDAGGTVKQPR